jgi:hypothetical protein
MYEIIGTDSGNCRFGKQYKTLRGATKKFYDLVNQNVKEVTIFLNAKKFHSVTQIEYVIKWYYKEGSINCYTNESKTNKELESKRYVPVKMD